jgi:hypothetical protein
MADRSKNKYQPNIFDGAAALDRPENSALADEFSSLGAVYVASADWLKNAERTLAAGITKARIDVELFRLLLALFCTLAEDKLRRLTFDIDDATSRFIGRQRGPRPSMATLERRYLNDLARSTGQHLKHKKPGRRTDFDWTEGKIRALDREAAAELKRCGKRPFDRVLVNRQMGKELAGTGRRVHKRDLDARCKRLSKARKKLAIGYRR